MVSKIFSGAIGGAALLVAGRVSSVQCMWSAFERQNPWKWWVLYPNKYYDWMFPVLCQHLQFCDNSMLENAWILNPMLGSWERGFIGYQPGLQPKNVRQPEVFGGFFCRRKRVHGKPLFERVWTFPLHDLQNTNARILGTPKFRRPV